MGKDFEVLPVVTTSIQDVLHFVNTRDGVSYVHDFLV